MPGKTPALPEEKVTWPEIILFLANDLLTPPPLTKVSCFVQRLRAPVCRWDAASFLVSEYSQLDLQTSSVGFLFCNRFGGSDRIEVDFQRYLETTTNTGMV